MTSRPTASLLLRARLWSVAFAGLSLWCAASCVAAPLHRDIGDGLAYFRAKSLPADLPPLDPPQPAVLDLRYAASDEAAAVALRGWLQFHAGARHPVFVLVNPSTAPSVLNELRRLSGTAGLLTVGSGTGTFRPDFPVTIAAAEERRAYDALEKDVPVAELTTDLPDKERNDEASLAGTPASAPSGGGPLPPAPDRSETEAGTTTATAPLDATLQRAIHLYRGLRALKAL